MGTYIGNNNPFSAGLEISRDKNCPAVQGWRRLQLMITITIMITCHFYLSITIMIMIIRHYNYRL